MKWVEIGDVYQLSDGYGQIEGMPKAEVLEIQSEGLMVLCRLTHPCGTIETYRFGINTLYRNGEIIKN